MTFLSDMPVQTGLAFLEVLDPDRFVRADREQLIEALRGIKESRESLIRRAVMSRRDDILARVLGYEVVPGLHDRMIWHEIRHRKSLLLVFRGSGKTTVTTVTRTIADLIRNRDLGILIASKSHQNAKDMLKTIKTHLETNEDLRSIFGEFVGQGRWDDEAIEIAGRAKARPEPSVNTVGVEGSVASKHYEIIRPDDLVEEGNSITALQRRRMLDWVYKVLDPCLLPPSADCPEAGQIHYNGTRYHTQDLYGHLIENEMEGERTLTIPIEDEQGQPVWKERFPRPWIDEKKKAMGTINFASQMRCSVKEMVGEYFRFDDCDQVAPGDYPAAEDVQIFIGVDLAISKKKGANKFAGAVIGRVPQRWDDIWVWDFYEGHLSFRKQRETIIEYAEKYRARLVRTAIETNQYQEAQAQEVRLEAPWINLAPLVTSSNKASRGALLAARFEAGHVHFVRGAHYRLIDHLVQFDATEGGADDLFDALDHAVQASEKKAKSQRRVREEEPDLI